MAGSSIIYTVFAVSCLFLFCGCFGDGRPVAAGAAHIYNGAEETVTVEVKSSAMPGATYTLAPGEGAFVALRKADAYVVRVTSPATFSYREKVQVPADDKTDYIFDIGGETLFKATPDFYVDQHLSDTEARRKVAGIKHSGKFPEYTIEEPATLHKLTWGIYYSFGDSAETRTRSNVDPGKVEVRYSLYALKD